MKTRNPFWWIVLALACPLPLAFAEPPAASQSLGLELGSPYVDLFHGFGLTPPAGAERSNDPIPEQLVSWRLRDAKTNVILWTLGVGKIVNKEAPDDLDAYAKSLAATLKEKENFQIASTEVHEIAGHQAVDIKGTTEGKVRWWQRQVQIASGKGNFVLLRMTGPADAAGSMDATMSAVLATVKIIDPKEALVQREKNLQAGAEFLKTVTPEKLKAAIQTEPLYVLASTNGKAKIGRIAWQSLGTREKVQGAEIRMKMLPPTGGDPEQPPTTLTWFCSADRTSESWEEKDGSRAGRQEKGAQTDWKITIETSSKIETAKTVTKVIPKEIRGCYMPGAFGMMLAQLLDLKKPATYGFAVYAAEAKAFDVYTVTVVGAVKIEIGGKEVQGYQVDIQPAEDASRFQMFVDQKGRFLRAVAAGGTDTAVDKETFFKAYSYLNIMLERD
jgi:hypothetical protein